MIIKSNNHFHKYQRIEVASLFQDLKTQKDVFRAFAWNNHFVKCVRISRTDYSFQNVIAPLNDTRLTIRERGKLVT